MVRGSEEDDEYLSWNPLHCFSHREAKSEEVTLETMADLMDQQAENCNAHDFVCVHRGLAVILFRQLGREKATQVFRQLIDFEGLYGMVGVCGRGDVEAHEEALGVSLQDWSDWQISEEARP
ncbi:hypothetical protein DB346_02925 [Verrucomicrobia bacterium LW23]|nr:hypothetical protein DB346_03730 [Verrucomicrobia bacterium LW23]PTY04402.1 hypothetical protein DB346_02925 [Verrucomicrobia bacterium LW23]